MADADRGTVSRIDARTHERLRQRSGWGASRRAIAVAGDGVWVANRPEGTLSVISARTNEVVRTVRVGRTVGGRGVGTGAVWAASPLDLAVVRFNAATGTPHRRPSGCRASPRASPAPMTRSG